MDNIEKMRHTLSHILAAAVKELYPTTKFGIGPAIDNGFYYDIDFGDVKISDTDLAKIEKKMRGIIARGLDMSNLVLIPLTLAGYARYLKGIKDDGTPFEPSPDPMLAELQAIVAPLEIGKANQDYSCLKALYSRKDVFGLDLYEAGLGEQIEIYVKELYAGPGAVRATLHKYVSAR